jgi:hypothetical protein
MTKPHLALVAPTTVIGTVGDRRSPPRRMQFIAYFNATMAKPFR